MKIAILARAALALAVLALPIPALAATFPPVDLTPFTTACRSHGGIQSLVATQPPGETLAVDRLCTCMAGQLTDVSQTDADMLTKDLLGTTTDEERMAYATYEDLNAFASAALDQCMISEGFTPGVAAAPSPAPVPEPTPVREPDPEPAVVAEPAPVEPAAVEPAPVAPVPAVKTPVAPPAETVAPVPPAETVATAPAAESDRLSAEAAGFLNACVTSSEFVGFLEEAQQGGGANQGTICSCLTGDLVTKVSAADMTVLAADFAPASLEAGPPEPAENYAEIAELALAGLRSCMTEAGVDPNF